MTKHPASAPPHAQRESRLFPVVGQGGIPAWPLIKWIKQVIAFLVTVCEVLVAIPLWLTFHMVPDGDGFASERTKTGYGILLEASLRPMLLLMGMLFSYMLMWPAVYFTATMLELSTTIVNTELGFTALFAMVGQAGLYAIVTLYVVDWSCDVIDGLSGRVMSWINIAPGHANNDLEGKVNHAFMAFRGELRGLKGMPKPGDKTKPGGEGAGDDGVASPGESRS